MKTKLISSILFSLISLISIAQSSSDALNFSQTFNGGTARFVGMGGAFGSLGGDFGALSYNPAGLGIYRSSEFTFTPSFKNRTVSSVYNGSSNEDSRSRFYFDNVGFVFSFKPNKTEEKGLVNFNIGFGFNRTNDFYSNSLVSGINSKNSIMDYYAGLANNEGLNHNLTDMAWNTYLIDTIQGSIGKYKPLRENSDVVEQQQTISTNGNFGEYVISFATNFSNKLFLGATLGIQDYSYSISESYEENADASNPILSNGYRFYSMNYSQNYQTNGTGYNLKLGLIYKLFDGLRLGFAIHTPTYFNFEDTYSSSMFSDIDSMSIQKTYLTNTPNSRYNYHFETPFKSIASIAYIYKDLGLISLDVEKIDYSKMRFRDSGDGYNYTSENKDLNDIYRSVYNFKVGSEVRFDQMFLRAGYAYYGSPYNKGFLNENSNRKLISGGIGYRSGNFLIDVAYLYSIQKEKYVFYYLEDNTDIITTNAISTKMTEGKFLLTMGFKF